MICNPLVGFGGFVIHINWNGIANPEFNQHWITNPMKRAKDVRGGLRL